MFYLGVQYLCFFSNCFVSYFCENEVLHFNNFFDTSLMLFIPTNIMWRNFHMSNNLKGKTSISFNQNNVYS